MINSILPHVYKPRAVKTLNGLQSIQKSPINFLPKAAATNGQTLNLHTMASVIKSAQNTEINNK